MTAAGWTALAALLLLTALPGARAARVDTLIGAGRLVAPVVVARVRPRPWWPVAAVVAAAAVVGVLVRAGPALAIAAAAVALVAGRLALDVRERRDSARRQAAVLGAVRVLAGELRAGSDPPSALEAAAEAAPLVGAELSRAAAEARGGRPAGPVLVAATDEGLRAAGWAWEIGGAAGSAFADVLGRVAADLESGAEQRRATAVALAGPRSSAAVLAGLPVLGVLLGAAMGAHPVDFLLGAPAGRVVCCVGALLDAGGVLWIRAVLRRSAAGP